VCHKLLIKKKSVSWKVKFEHILRLPSLWTKFSLMQLTYIYLFTATLGPLLYRIQMSCSTHSTHCLAPVTPTTVFVSDSLLTAETVDKCEAYGTCILCYSKWIRTLSSTVMVTLQLSLTYLQLSLTFLLLFLQFSFCYFLFTFFSLPFLPIFCMCATSQTLSVPLHW